MTLQQAQLFERIRHMADHDPLTGLANPRVFHRKAAAAERAARRHKTPLGVLVIDIDDFKRSTTSTGMPMAIACCARQPRSCAAMRVWRTPRARLGGDELALLLPRTGAEDVRSIADRLARAFEREGIRVSIGLAAPRSIAS